MNDDKKKYSSYILTFTGYAWGIGKRLKCSTEIGAVAMAKTDIDLHQTKDELRQRMVRASGIAVIYLVLNV